MTRYGKLCTIIYDLDKPLAGEAETGVYTRSVESKTEPILEPMCGSGRFLIPLLRTGYNISGFDLSEDMLAACRRRCAALGLAPRVFQADIVRFEPGEQYRYAFIPFGSLSLIISDNDFRRGLLNIHRGLEEKGVFVLSFLGPKSRAEENTEWKETMNHPYGDKRIVCLSRSVFRKSEGVLDIKLRYEVRRGEEVLETEHQDFPIKLREEDSVIKTLESIGFGGIERAANAPPQNRFSILKCAKTVRGARR